MKRRFLEPYWEYTTGSASSGKTTGKYFGIRTSSKVMPSAFSRAITNPYRELQSGGIMFGAFGRNVWVSDDDYFYPLCDKIVGLVMR